jgi:hypothetical protein
MNKTQTPTPVVLVLTRRQAEALASLITRSDMHDRWVHSVRNQLPRSLAELQYQRSSAAGSAFAAARTAAERARVDIMTEREATDVAQAAVSTAKSVVRAALITAEAAERERNRKADAAQTATHERAPTAAGTATTSEESAYTTAERVASDAAQAAEIVAAAIASGGDAATALAALQVTRDGLAVWEHSATGLTQVHVTAANNHACVSTSGRVDEVFAISILMRRCRAVQPFADAGRFDEPRGSGSPVTRGEREACEPF